MTPTITGYEKFTGTCLSSRNSVRCERDAAYWITIDVGAEPAKTLVCIECAAFARSKFGERVVSLATYRPVT